MPLSTATTTPASPRYDEKKQSAPWKNALARELNVLLGRADYYETEPEMLPCDVEVVAAIRSVVTRVAEFEDLEFAAPAGQGGVS